MNLADHQGHATSTQSDKCLIHDHQHIQTLDHARLFKTGEIDVALFDASNMHLDEEIRQHPIVSVKATQMAHNAVRKRDEAVFLVTTQSGHMGHYFAGAFKSLCL